MSPVPLDDSVVAANTVAGLLLVARAFLEKLGLPCPSAKGIIEATGASKTCAYDAHTALLAILPTLVRPPGRPAAPPEPRTDTGELSRNMLLFLHDHPGGVTPGDTRNRYSDGYRHRVVELHDAHRDLGIAQLAHAVCVPAATVEDWLALPITPLPRVPAAPQGPPNVTDATDPQIASILDAWGRWDGGFSSFCAFVRAELLIPVGPAFVRRILEVHTSRRRKRRSGRSPDEKATRKALITFFPGAQWFADGSSITITVNGQKHTFNWELDVDGFSGALVGASLRDQEDATAVIDAFADGVTTTGAAPLALTTDNRAANLTAEVEDALGTTLHIQTTPGRPQNDAPIEGAFGLFAQTAPPLVVTGATEREVARSMLRLVLTTWARATNHRPRNDRDGRSRVQLYRDEVPTTEQILAATRALDERRRLQRLAEATRQARLNPIIRALLDDAFDRLGLVDLTGNVKDAIARHPHDAVLAGIATFEGKRVANTLPPGVGPRYLLGIVSNIAERDEGLAAAEVLWRLRRDAQDQALVALDQARQATTGTHEERIRSFVDRALAGQGTLLRSFWLCAAAEVIVERPPEQRKNLYDLAVRRVTGTFRVDAYERQAAVRYLAAHILPVA